MIFVFRCWMILLLKHIWHEIWLAENIWHEFWLDKRFGRDVRVRAGLGKYSPWMPRTKFPSPAHKKAPGWSHTIFLSQNVSSKASCWADLHLDFHWFQFRYRSLTFKITPHGHEGGVGQGLGEISERWILTVKNISIFFLRSNSSNWYLDGIRRAKSFAFQTEWKHNSASSGVVTLITLCACLLPR